MYELFNAIYSHYLVDPLAESLTDFYNMEAPENAKFPYGIFSLIDTADWTFSENFENCLIQFTLYSKSLNEVCNLFKLLKGDPAVGTGFDFHDLEINNYETILLQRETAILTKVENVWQYSVTYRILIQEVAEAVRQKVEKYLYNLLSIY